nr:MAG TPA_asm: hypothetical protein [Caudoviricetes sp.]
MVLLALSLFSNNFAKFSFNEVIEVFNIKLFNAKLIY